MTEIHIRLDDKIAEQVKKFAARERRSVNAQVEVMLAEAIEARSK